MDKIIIIAGPTASSKTSTSIEIAKMLDGEIICADSMQIYKYMDIGTAKVTKEEMQDIPHYMYDIVEPNETYSVFDYVQNAKKHIKDIINRKKTPILVGGTGLYFESLIYPFGLGVKSDDKIKQTLLDELEKYGAEYLHNKLKEIDPIEAEKTHANNTKRVVRALEIYYSSGKRKSEINENKELLYDVDFNVLTFDRGVLYDRINMRVDLMFEYGLEREIKSLLDRGYTFDMQSMQAIGYKEFKDYYSGDITLNDTIELIKKNSRNYAKRQITWFKRYPFADNLSPNDCILKYKNK